MRDFLEASNEELSKDPEQRARELSKRELPKRFYKDVTYVAGKDGFAIHLDGRTVKTPAKATLLLPSETLAAAVAAWDDKEWFETTRHEVMAGRENLRAELVKLGFDVLPSATNFVLASHKDISAATLQAKLKENGILVRHFKQPRIDNWLRITVGTSEQSEKLIEALNRIL